MAKKKFYRPVLFALFRVLQALFRPLPYRAGFLFAGFVGVSAFRLLRREREKTLRHLQIAFPEKSAAERTLLGESNFRNYGYSIAELALIDRSLKSLYGLVTLEGRAHLDRALERGNGVVGISAHFGNWELLGGYLAHIGYPVSVVARKIYFESYNRKLLRLREKMNVQTLDRDRSARDVLRALKANRIVGFVADQDVDTVDGIFVDFFGRPAYTPTAPVRFAAKTGASLMPFFIVREGMRHRIVIEPAMELDSTGDAEEDLRCNTQRWAFIQEKYIRQYPHLWVWNHKRWKTVPKPLFLSEVSR